MTLIAAYLNAGVILVVTVQRQVYISLSPTSIPPFSSSTRPVWFLWTLSTRFTLPALDHSWALHVERTGAVLNREPLWPVTERTDSERRLTQTGLHTQWRIARGTRAQELCQSRGGRPGFPSLISLRFLWT